MATPEQNLTRERYLRKLHAACSQYGYAMGCIVPGCTGRPILHHFVPRRAGGSNAIANLIAICPAHEKPLHAAGHAARIMAGDGPMPPRSKMTPRRPPPRIQYGCADCLFSHPSRPPYCPMCKQRGTSMGSVDINGPTLKTLADLDLRTS